MINLRPGWDNKSRNVDNPATQDIIKIIIQKLIELNETIELANEKNHA